MTVTAARCPMLAELLKGGPVTWQGKTRASLHNQDVVPHTESTNIEFYGTRVIPRVRELLPQAEAEAEAQAEAEA